MENPKPEEVKDVKKNELSEEDLKKVKGGAVDILLKIDAVDGESRDKTHHKDID
jgi:bacteriocin-like protein